MKKNTRKQANKSQRKGSFSDKSQAYLHLHAHGLFSSLGRLVRTPFTSIMTVLVMAIAISLATGFHLLVINMQQLTGKMESTNQISLFLKSSVSEGMGKSIADKIRKNSQIEKVLLITKEQALDEFKTHSGFGDALQLLETNPLPIVIQVLPKNTLDDMQSVEHLMTDFAKLPQVDFTKMDLQWVKRLQSIMQIMERSVFLLAILLGLAVLLITGNTIRLELQNRRDEVLVAKLVGATHSFIQRPFLYTGFWLGFFSGFVAWIIVSLMMLILQSPIEKLSVLYDGAFKVLYLSFTDTITLLIIASFLGMIGAWIVLRYQLKLIKPE